MKEHQNVHSERITKELLSNKYFHNKAIRDSSQMVKDNSFSEVMAKITVFCQFLSGLDDQPVKVEDALVLSTEEVNAQSQSRCGSAEKIYLDRDS